MNGSVLDPAAQKQKTHNTTHLPPPRENDKIDDNAKDVVEHTRTTTYLRPKVKFAGPKINATKTIKSYILQLRKADPLVQILPLDEENASANDILSHENDLPDEQSAMEKWIEKVEVVGNRLNFIMRISTIDIEKMKKHIFEWSGKTGSYSLFLKEKNVSIFGAGWIHGLSAEYYNRDHIMEYIVKHRSHFRGKVIIYAKEVYHYKERDVKVKTYAIVFDCHMEIKDDFIEFMYSHQWTGRYQQLTFVPYKSNEIFTPKMQAAMVESHNKYLTRITRKIIKIANARVEYEVNGKQISFQDWFASSLVGGSQVVLGVEVAPKNIVRVIYNKDDNHIMATVLAELYDNVGASFGPGVAEVLMDTTQFKNSKQAYNRELDYAKKILAKCDVNPQDPPETQVQTPTRRAQMYFGSYAEATTGTQEEKANVISQSELSQSDTSITTQDSKEIAELRGQLSQLQESHKLLESRLPTAFPSTPDENVPSLQQQINELSTSQKQLESKVTTTLATEVKNTITKEMQPLRESIQNEYKSKHEKFEEKLKPISELFELQNESYETRFKSIQTSMETNVTTTLNNALDAYFKKKESPSGTESSSRGVDK